MSKPESIANPTESQWLSSLTPVPPWDMYTVGVTLSTGYILMPLLVSNISILINPFLDPVGQLCLQQGVTLLTWTLIFIWLRCQYGPIGEYLGLRLSRPLPYYAWETIKLLLLSSSLTLLANQLWALLSHYFPHWQLGQTEPYSQYTTPELVTLSMFAVFMAPLLEEVIFRGFVQAAFHKISTPMRSVIFTCLVFLLFHGSYFDNVKALSHVLILGLCFGFWRERTQSLLPSITVHFFNNSLASIILLMRHFGHPIGP